MPLTKIYKHKNFKNVTLLIFIAVFILIGIILFTSSRATGPFVSVNSDQGNVKTPASIQSSSQVNDGKYVLFGSGASGNGSITFDGTFSTNDPASGPHWNNAYGSCYQFTAANQLTMTPNSSCSPDSNHLRTDICSSPGCNATSSTGQLFTKGVSSCTTIPFYLPRQIPSPTGNSWYQIAEMKDYTSNAADWGIYISGGLEITGATSADHFTTIYQNSTTITAGIWHTASICTNNNDVVIGAWYDGNRLTFNAGGCSGSQTCSGRDLFYDGFNTQPLDINAYTGNTSGTDPYGGYTVIHGDPLIATIGSNGLPPIPPNGWNSP